MQHISSLSFEEIKENEQEEEISPEWNEKIAQVSKLLSNGDHFNAEEKKELLAKAKYLISKDEAILNIEYEFQRHLEEKKQSLTHLRKIYQITGLKGERSAVSLKKAYTIADLLVQQDGKINTDLIPLIKREFEEKDDTPRLMLGLNELQSDELLDRIHTLKLPEKKDARSFELIRIAMNIFSQRPVTVNDARKLLVSSLLCNFRQGKRGTCFSTPLIIASIYAAHKKHLEDLFSLIEKSAVKREVTVLEEFPFILRNNPLYRYETVTLDKSGKISGQLPLWELPGVDAVCKYLKIENPDRVLCKELKLPGQISLEEVIHTLVKNGKINANFGARAFFVFNAQNIHPLLSAWENALSAIAEGFSSSMIRSRVCGLVNTAIMSELKLPSVPLDNKLKERIGFLYDTHVLINEESPLDGAFIMYDKSNPDNWIKIESEEQFKNFLSKIFEHNEAITRYVQGKRFMDEINTGYDPHDERNRPWKTFSGNNFEDVLRIFSERKNKVVIQPKNAENLLLQLIECFRKYSEEKKKEMQSYPQERTPARLYHLHAFTILEGNASLHEILDPKKNVDQWIRNRLIAPFTRFSEIPINNKIKKKTFEICMSNIRSEKVRKRIETVINTLKEGMSISKFRRDIAGSLRQPKNRLMCKIDRAIIESLPEHNRRQLLHSSVHIADSNWEINGEDLHLAFMFNPGTERLDLWLISENNEDFIAIDQNSWTRGKPWEIYTDD